MKTKNAALGISAFLLAAGCALASVITPQHIYVKAKLTFNGPITCVDTEESCNNAGAFACRVQIMNVNVGQDITPNTFRNSTCLLPLLDGDPTCTPKVSSIRVFQLF